MDRLISLIDRLESSRSLSADEWAEVFRLLEGQSSFRYLQEKARNISRRTFGNKVYVRGLIEFTNYCRNNCYYCGIRAGNRNLQRYRLTTEEILQCCRKGYALGFRTFVLQGGEDSHFSYPGGPSRPEELIRLIASIRREFPDCAITLSIGEWDREAYQAFYDAGADRYLLRHETADPDHYAMLHPKGLSLENRKRCLWDLKEIGFQVGTGFMVGSPGQSPECLAEDMRFIEELQPQMVGIGPFVPHHDTPFAGEPGGTAEETLHCISLLRLVLPEALIPATTALGTIDPAGREKGILAGANVVMPNLSPVRVREQYQLYDNKICTGEEAAECRGCLEGRMEMIGYEIVTDRGDHPSFHPGRKESAS